MLITFVDNANNRKFGFDGVRKIQVTVTKAVHLSGIDAVTGERYGVRVDRTEYSYFTLHKEDDDE